MRMHVLGGCGVWPAAGEACSGYLVQHDGFVLLIDPGYATVPRLLEQVTAEAVDAVVVTHGHPDHCADLNPLLRARHLRDDPSPALAVFALPGAVGPVLALDRPGMLDAAYTLHDLAPGEPFSLGPFEVETWMLPHSVPNVGIRVRAGAKTLAYTGDSGPSPHLVPLASGAEVFMAETTFPEHVPPDLELHLSSALQAGQTADRAGVGRLVLTHLPPDADPDASAAAARRAFDGEVTIARPGLVVDLAG